MFNLPLLDTAIGLVFIFLLYSLLVTSINEALATFFGIRAKMLKSAIIEGMLSDTSKDNRWLSFVKGIGSFFVSLFHWEKKPSGNEKKIGDNFFDHPLIKNYGSSRFFPLPSYISTSNFSTVLMDVLKREFDSKVDDIAKYKSSLPDETDSLENITQNLKNASDLIKVKELLEYYGHYYLNINAPPPNSIIDKDTWQILQMLLKTSVYDLQKFVLKIENWYDDSMNRVSGWYKRQTQFILFVLGFIIAVIFNVDTIQIAGKISTDKDARDKLVLMATQAVDKYKDDPRVKKIVQKDGTIIPDTVSKANSHNDSIFKQYQAKMDDVKAMIKGEIDSTNGILAMGWGDYGMKRDGDKVIAKYGVTVYPASKNMKLTKADSIKTKQHILDSLYNRHWLKCKVGYVAKESLNGRKILSFLILAFAVSLGAPFWFDLLNKIVKIRGTGKKEEIGDDTSNTKTNAVTAPVNVIINQPATGEEEAVG